MASARSYVHHLHISPNRESPHQLNFTGKMLFLKMTSWALHKIHNRNNKVYGRRMYAISWAVYLSCCNDKLSSCSTRLSTIHRRVNLIKKLQGTWNKLQQKVSLLHLVRHTTRYIISKIGQNRHRRNGLINIFSKWPLFSTYRSIYLINDQVQVHLMYYKHIGKWYKGFKIQAVIGLWRHDDVISYYDLI